MVQNTAGRFDEAEQSYQFGRFTEAAALFQELVREQPENSLGYQGLGLSLFRLGCYDDAVAALTRALELDPQLAISHGALGQIYLKRQAYERARAELETAVQIDPNNTVVRTTLGVLHLERKLYSEAIRELNLAIETDPRQSLAYINLGNAYVQVGRVWRGLSAYWIAMKVDPRTWGLAATAISSIPLRLFSALPTPIRVLLALLLVLLVFGRNPLSWPIWCSISLVAVIRSIFCIFVEKRVLIGVLLLFAVSVFTAFLLLRPA